MADSMIPEGIDPASLAEVAETYRQLEGDIFYDLTPYSPPGVLLAGHRQKVRDAGVSIMQGGHEGASALEERRLLVQERRLAETFHTELRKNLKRTGDTDLAIAFTVFGATKEVSDTARPAQEKAREAKFLGTLAGTYREMYGLSAD